ncbi:UNVERIFIED_CONTAM: Pentatricopeptide repeat-containing protein [Sesamum latifolium]|uniref:Pentatricopeptide repeat-containing protein n=1 Tax=Sesamum latifolium TaxID=2727402 RepID=A0AAW2U0Q4_9LAMI
MKKLFLKRNYTSLSRTHCGHYHSIASQIIQLCRAGSVSDAILLLSSINSTSDQQNAVSKPIIYATIVHACMKSLHFTVGLQLHCHLIKSGLETDRFVGNSLLALYFKLGSDFNDTRKCFDGLHYKDVVSWSSIISGYIRVGRPRDAIEMYLEMLGFDIEPNAFTLSAVIKACSEVGEFKLGKSLHSVVLRCGFESNEVIVAALIDMYGRSSGPSECRQLFDEMLEPDAVCCTSVISALTRNMEKDLYSFGTVLRACAGLAAEKLGKELHCQYLKRGSWRDVVVESALVDLYAKCGCVDFAYRIFLKMPVKNLITWNSMIGGFAQNGRGEEAVRIFNQMIQERVKPDYISFIEVLFACSHSGLVDQGRKYFISMYNDYGLKAGSEHYSCMVDLLGRAGKIEEAEDLIVKSEFRNNPSLWAALLGACATTTNPTVAERIAKKMIELKPDYHLSYVLLANVYRAVGRWKDSHKIWNQMQKRGVKKLPGKSWIDNSSLNPLLCLNSTNTPTEMYEWWP